MFIDPAIFRSYDIRGVVATALTPEVVQLIGQAIGTMTIEAGVKEVAIARDARLSGAILAEALMAGLMSTGCDVIDLGLAPTPALYYAAHIFPHRTGVMLTGSHNPAEYNGLKSIINGQALSDVKIQEVYQRVLKQDFIQGTGSSRQCDILQDYIQVICDKITLTKPLKVVIDAGNGITGMMAPALFTRLGCEVIPLFCELDGNFPHHHPDPTQPENLQHLIAAVLEAKADIGLAFDGDGDRLGVVTDKGEIIWPDRLLMLYAQDVLKDQPQANIIYDVKCTNHLAAVISASGGVPVMWKTGHSHIKSKLIEINALLAGEMSGHFFFNDRWFGFDDGLYAGARLLEILARSEKTAHELFAAIPNSINTPELKIPVADHEKFLVMEQLIAKANFVHASDINTIDGLRVNFAEGWGLLRPSNTTPYLVLRFEANNESVLETIQTFFREWIYSVRPDLVLPF